MGFADLKAAATEAGERQSLARGVPTRPARSPLDPGDQRRLAPRERDDEEIGARDATFFEARFPVELVAEEGDPCAVPGREPVPSPPG